MNVVSSVTETEIAQIELRYCPRIPPSALPRIETPQCAYNHFLATWDKEKIEFIEEFKVMLLNRNRRVLGICPIASGSITSVLADPKLIFVAALKTSATGIILAHNHPSGCITPGKLDTEMSLQLKEGGRLLDIMVLDHIIVTRDRYYSFADEGII